MKKILFSALLAIVAVGGALTASAVTYYGPNNTLYDCTSSGDAFCSAIEGPIWEDENEGGAEITDPSTFFGANVKYVQ